MIIISNNWYFTISPWLFTSILLWDLEHKYLGPANTAIQTAVFFICDSIIIVNKKIKTNQADYTLVTKQSINDMTLLRYMWFGFISIIIPLLNVSSVWLIFSCMHVYSPFKIFISYSFLYYALLVILANRIMLKYYKKWLMSLNITPTGIIDA